MNEGTSKIVDLNEVANTENYRGVVAPSAATPSNFGHGHWVKCESNGTYVNYSNLAANAGDKLTYNAELTVWEKTDGNPNMSVLSGDLDADGNKISNLAPGILPNGAINFSQLDKIKKALPSIYESAASTLDLYNIEQGAWSGVSGWISHANRIRVMTIPKLKSGQILNIAINAGFQWVMVEFANYADSVSGENETAYIDWSVNTTHKILDETNYIVIILSCISGSAISVGDYTSVGLVVDGIIANGFSDVAKQVDVVKNEVDILKIESALPSVYESTSSVLDLSNITREKWTLANGFEFTTTWLAVKTIPKVKGGQELTVSINAAYKWTIVEFANYQDSVDGTDHTAYILSTDASAILNSDTNYITIFISRIDAATLLIGDFDDAELVIEGIIANGFNDVAKQTDIEQLSDELNITNSLINSIESALPSIYEIKETLDLSNITQNGWTLADGFVSSSSRIAVRTIPRVKSGQVLDISINALFNYIIVEFANYADSVSGENAIAYINWSTESTHTFNTATNYFIVILAYIDNSPLAVSYYNNIELVIRGIKKSALDLSVIARETFSLTKGFTSATTRLSVRDIYKFKGGQTLEITIASGYEYTVIEFANYADFIIGLNYNFYTAWQTATTFTLQEDTKYVAFLIKLSTDTTIIVSDFDTTGFTVTGLISEQIDEGAVVSKGDLLHSNSVQEGTIYNNGTIIRIHNPYKYKGRHRLRGQMHCHSTNSDGIFTPDEVVALFKSVGYDFCTITDHNYITTEPAGNELIWLCDSYEHNDTGAEAWTHHCIYNCSDIYTGNDGILGLYSYFYTNGNSILNWAHTDLDEGGEDAHLDEVDGGLSFTEVINGTSSPTSPVDYFEQTERGFKRLLNNGQNVYAIAVDDMHSLNHLKKGWVEVLSDGKDPNDIWLSLLRGSFFANSDFLQESNGVSNPSVDIVNGTMQVSVDDPEATIEFIGSSGSLQTSTGSSLASKTVAQYKILGTEVWIYAKITVLINRICWTQPIKILEVLKPTDFIGF